MGGRDGKVAQSHPRHASGDRGCVSFRSDRRSILETGCRYAWLPISDFAVARRVRSCDIIQTETGWSSMSCSVTMAGKRASQPRARRSFGAALIDLTGSGLTMGQLADALSLAKASNALRCLLT